MGWIGVIWSPGPSFAVYIWVKVVPCTFSKNIFSNVQTNIIVEFSSKRRWRKRYSKSFFYIWFRRYRCLKVQNWAILALFKWRQHFVSIFCKILNGCNRKIFWSSIEKCYSLLGLEVPFSRYRGFKIRKNAKLMLTQQIYAFFRNLKPLYLLNGTS